MGNRNMRGMADITHEQVSNSGNTLQSIVIGSRTKRKKFEPSIKKSRNMRKPRVLNKTKSTRAAFSTMKHLFGDKIPVMLAFIASESDCCLRLEKKPIKSISTQNQDVTNEKSCRRVSSFPCATYCRECRKSSSKCVY
ncbi:unnamed protein product [Euphydryas editha]|uniref:Agouti signaling protein n=1 Tax=Euphydryas editha TaxID=104508 RepID=A0AAU9ULT7_EUPED|nr:unnamed protein product [Euphydryas editha]